MLTLTKQRAKFRNYWCEDDHFRFLVYNYFDVSINLNKIFSNTYNIDAKFAAYSDAHVDLNLTWSFLLGLIFPSRLMDKKVYQHFNEEFNLLGKEFSLGGRWLSFWIWATEKEFKISKDELEQNSGLSSNELKIFRAGKYGQFPSEGSQNEKAIYLWGRDFDSSPSDIPQTIKKLLRK
jgi:hypothetical protein